MPTEPRHTKSDVPRYRRGHQRHGRLLVEGLVTLLLLATAGLMLTASVRAVATLADDAVQVSHAQADATSRAEHVLSQGCVAPTAPLVFASRHATTVIAGFGQSALRAQRVVVHLFPSPISLRDTQQLTLSTARSCP